MIESERDTPISPEVLLSEIASGNKIFEQHLVSSYWKGLFFVLNRQSQNPDLAADLTQEALLVVILKARAGEITTPSALPAYIRQTGVNLLIAHYRKEQRRKTDDTDEIDVQFADMAPSTSQQLHAKALLGIVEQVMAELPTARDRDILMRFFKYGEEKPVICRALELTPEHFDRVLFRARQRFKQVLQTKLDIDVKDVSLSHLLSITAVLASTQMISAQEIELLFSDMRGSSVSNHLYNSETEAVSSRLTAKSSISLRRSYDANTL